MTVTLGLNIASLRVQRQLNSSGNRIADVLARLSSGQRITNAADDPAGLAVSMRLHADVRIANKARENVNTGISLLQVADGALDSIRSLLQRQMELAEQSANGSLSEDQRQSLQEEYKQLDAEIRRITKSTEFNGIDLLKGDASANASRQLIAQNVAFDYKKIDISGNGRYAVYQNLTDGTVEQLDIDTGERTVVATGFFGAIAQSASGERVVFWSNGNFTGEDPSGYGQLYMWDRNEGEISQITHGTNPEAWSSTNLYTIAISADGSTVGFGSANHYNPDGTVSSYTPAGGTIHLYDVASQSFTDLNLVISTDVDYMSFSADGSQFAFSSYNNLTGQNADNSNELFYYDNRSGGSSLVQITNSAGAQTIGGVQITNDGKVYFGTTADLVGQNGSFAGQLFEYSVATSSITQLTNADTGVLIVDKLGVDDSSLYFRTTGDLTGENSGHVTQFFELDRLFGGITQMTNYTGTSEIELTGRISHDGRTFVKISAGGYLEAVDFSPDSTTINISTGSGEDGIISAVIDALNGTLKGIGGLSIGTQGDARTALENARDNIENLSIARGKIGAGFSRLEIANRLLSSQALEKQAAEARIMDADIAFETAELVKNQILQQISTSLLAQANQNGQLAVKLLRLR
ncbi:MAG: hypothetical protein KDD70_05415 [Bdellovibrionales bacterium]|nr:hypothetical protein [Bdellovibrionales bacterium]